MVTIVIILQLCVVVLSFIVVPLSHHKINELRNFVGGITKKKLNEDNTGKRVGISLDREDRVVDFGQFIPLMLTGLPAFALLESLIGE